MAQQKFALGQRVRIARLLDSITSRELIGKIGAVEAVEQLPSGAFNYYVGGHYVHEEELEALE